MAYSVVAAYGTDQSTSRVEVMQRPTFIALTLLLPLSLGLATPAIADRKRDQDAAFEAARAGKIRSLGEIISRTNQRVDGRYIGSDILDGSRTYRLKYMRGSSVIRVDVDAASGQIISTSDD